MTTVASSAGRTPAEGCETFLFCLARGMGIVEGKTLSQRVLVEDLELFHMLGSWPLLLEGQGVSSGPPSRMSEVISFQGGPLPERHRSLRWHPDGF